MASNRDRIRALAAPARGLLSAARHKTNRGYCPICAGRTLFVEDGAWLRDNYRCVRCWSLPRWRALFSVLNAECPEWRQARMHESSPGGSASEAFLAQCSQYSSSQFFADVAPGSTKDGVRCENLEALTFPDHSFDILVTQDVLEHVLRPHAAVKEIGRVLSPGGVHVFTVPIFWGRQTVIRAEPGDAGAVRLLLPAEYHGNPIDPNGSLVVREWGDDFLDFVFEQTGMETVRHEMHDRRQGFDGEFLDVFVTRKRPAA